MQMPPLCTLCISPQSIRNILSSVAELCLPHPASKQACGLFSCLQNAVTASLIRLTGSDILVHG